MTDERQSQRGDEAGGATGFRSWARLALIRLLRYPHRLVPAALGRNAALPAFADGTPFGALLDRSRRLAGHWVSFRAHPGSRILIDLPNDPTFIEARLACLLGGFTAVPVPPGTDERRLGWLAEFSEAHTYLGPRGDQPARPRRPPPARPPGRRPGNLRGGTGWGGAAPALAPHPRRRPSDPQLHLRHHR